MSTLRYAVLAGAVAIIMLPKGAATQERQAQSDTLAQRVRELQARVDSLQRVLEQLVAQGRDTLEAVDELAALRAAARAIAPEAAADTTPRQHVLRSGNLNDLNPEISITGDVRLRASRPGPQQDAVDLREFQFGFRSALDPYSNVRVYFSLGENDFGLEEAYVYWTGLPGGTRLDLGRFRQPAGELNRWHLHAMPESEYPLVIREFFGDDGLIGNGVSAYWLTPFQTLGGAVHELQGQVTLSSNDMLYQGTNRLSFLGHLNNFWQVSRSTYFQIGGTAAYGENPDSSLQTTTLGADFRLTWRPPERAMYSSLTVRGEGFWVRQNFAGAGAWRFGGYLSATAQVSLRIHLGARFDFVEPLAANGEHVWAIVPHVTFWQSEWVLLRAEWQRQSVPLIGGGRQSSDLFVLQTIWSIGPHKHESY
jgi:hypothetical protein